MVDVSERTYMIRFENKRERPSVTHGAGMGLQGESRRRLRRLKELNKYKIEKENKKMKLLAGFSLKRAVGITKVKNRISRKTKIPLTRSGRQRKIGKLLGIR